MPPPVKTEEAVVITVKPSSCRHSGAAADMCPPSRRSSCSTSASDGGGGGGRRVSESDGTGGARRASIAIKKDGSDDRGGAGTGLVEHASWVDVAAMGLICSTTGGTAFWNSALYGGVVPGIIAIFLGGIGFFMLQLSAAELSSAIPFSAGSYGFSRLAFNRLVAVLVGLTELLGYILNVVAFTSLFGTAFTMALGNNVWGTLIQAQGALALVVAIQIVGGRHLWRTVLCIAGLMMVIQLFYLAVCFSTTHLNMAKYGALVAGTTGSAAYSPGFRAFLVCLPPGVNFYVGIESLVLSAEDTKEPRKQLPKGIVASMGVAMAFALVTPLVVASSPLGMPEIIEADLPLQSVMGQVFGPRVGDKVTGWLGLVALLGGVLSNAHAANRITYALARAGVLPHVLSRTRQGSPFFSILLCSMAEAILTAYVVLVGGEGYDIINNASILCGLFHYVLILASYIVMRSKFSDLPRDFQSPVGVRGSLLGLAIFLLSLCAIFIITEGILVALGVWAGLLLLWASYYLVYAQFRIRLSPEEVVAISTQVTAAKMLKTGLGYSYLHDHCAREYSTENIICWKIIEEFRSLPVPSVPAFDAVYLEHLAPEAPQLVNVPSTLFAESKRVYDTIKSTIVSKNLSSPPSPAGPRQSLLLFPAHSSSSSSSSSSHGSEAQPAETTPHVVSVVNILPGASGAPSSSAAPPPTPPSTLVEHDPTIRLLMSEASLILTLVQTELLMLIEKDTLPRFKATEHFIRYLEKEPVMFRTLPVGEAKAGGATAGGRRKSSVAAAS